MLLSRPQVQRTTTWHIFIASSAFSWLSGVTPAQHEASTDIGTSGNAALRIIRATPNFGESENQSVKWAAGCVGEVTPKGKECAAG